MRGAAVSGGLWTGSVLFLLFLLFLLCHPTSTTALKVTEQPTESSRQPRSFFTLLAIESTIEEGR